LRLPIFVNSNNFLTLKVTRPSFSLIWQPNPCGLKCIQNNKNVTKTQANGHSKNSTGSASSTSTSSSTSSTSSQQQPSTSSSNYLSTIINSSSSTQQQIPSIVKFPFERKTAKEFVVELELFDKVFLHKRDLVKLKVNFFFFNLFRLRGRGIVESRENFFLIF